MDLATGTDTTCGQEPLAVPSRSSSLTLHFHETSLRYIHTSTYLQPTEIDIDSLGSLCSFNLPHISITYKKPLRYSDGFRQGKHPLLFQDNRGRLLCGIQS